MSKITTAKLISIKDFAAEYGIGLSQAYMAAKKGESRLAITRSSMNFIR